MKQLCSLVQICVQHISHLQQTCMSMTHLKINKSNTMLFMSKLIVSYIRTCILLQQNHRLDFKKIIPFQNAFLSEQICLHAVSALQL